MNSDEENLNEAPRADSPTPEDSLSRQWKEDVKRLICRNEIEKHLGASSVREIVDKVREYEQRVGVDKLLNDLVDLELNVSPKMAELSNFVFEKLSKTYPEIEAVVLLGSSVHGGALIRQVTGSMYEPDFDWGIITDRPVSANKASEINQAAKNILPQIISRFGLNESFHICFAVNPRLFRTESLENPQQARRLLFERANSEIIFDPMEWYQKAVFFLHPSYPQSVNSENRKMLLEGLSLLAKENMKLWRETVDLILVEWVKHHQIKRKHFLTAGRKRDDEIMYGVDQNNRSQTAMGKVMRELLESTGR